MRNKNFIGFLLIGLMVSSPLAILAQVSATPDSPSKQQFIEVEVAKTKDSRNNGMQVLSDTEEQKSSATIRASVVKRINAIQKIKIKGVDSRIGNTDVGEDGQKQNPNFKRAHWVGGNLTELLAATIGRLYDLHARIEARIEKMEDAGINMKEPRQLLKIAKEEVREADEEFENLSAVYASWTGYEPNYREIKLGMLTMFKKLKVSIMEAHASLVEVIVSINNSK